MVDGPEPKVPKVPKVPKARPGATEVGPCPVEKNPARPGATEAGQCHGEKNPVWARVWARVKECTSGATCF